MRMAAADAVRLAENSDLLIVPTALPNAPTPHPPAPMPLHRIHDEAPPDSGGTTILRAEPLEATAFAPFGDVVELANATRMSINAGTTTRFHDLAAVDVTAEGGRALINVFRAQPQAMPVRLRLMERHPLGSQCFLPLAQATSAPYLVVVAPDDGGRPGPLRAFFSRGWQGVNYARNVWHHPLLALDAVCDFVVVDRGGAGVNLEECPIDGAVHVEWPGGR